MEKYLFDSELVIMQILWQEGGMTAKQIAKITKDTVGWSKTTTYTVLKNCINKSLIERSEPNFFCIPLISEKDAQRKETDLLVKRLYHDSPDLLIMTLLEAANFKPEKILELKNLIENSL